MREIIQNYASEASAHTLNETKLLGLWLILAQMPLNEIKQEKVPYGLIF